MTYERLLKHRQSARGASYHITFCAHARQPLFRAGRMAAAVARSLQLQDTASRCESYAWVVMPDHVHWLFALPDQRGTLGEVVGRCRSDASRLIRGFGTHDGAIWQRGYYEHRLRAEDDLVIQARYLVANPLRAGLVARLVDYPWWYARWASPPHGPMPPSGRHAERLLD